MAFRLGKLRRCVRRQPYRTSCVFGLEPERSFFPIKRPLCGKLLEGGGSDKNRNEPAGRPIPRIRYVTTIWRLYPFGIAAVAFDTDSARCFALLFPSTRFGFFFFLIKSSTLLSEHTIYVVPPRQPIISAGFERADRKVRRIIITKISAGRRYYYPVRNSITFRLRDLRRNRSGLYL